MKNLKEVMAGVANNIIHNLQFNVSCKVSGEEIAASDVFLTSKAYKLVENVLKNCDYVIVTGQVQRDNSFSFKELIIKITSGARDRTWGEG